MPLRNLSPSQLETFDSRTPFGCERKWWFQSAPLGPHLKSSNESTLLGDQVHARVEEWQGRPVMYGPWTEEVMARRIRSAEIFKAGLPMVKTLKEKYGFMGYEASHNMMLDGVMFWMRLDVVLGRVRPLGVLDWKTTSDIDKWAKTAKQLREGIQMVLYAKKLAFMEPVWPLKIIHGYFQTKGEYDYRPVETEISKQHLDDRIENDIIPLIRRMKVAAEVSDVKQLKPENENKCRRCEFYSRCPRGGNMASIKDLLNDIIPKAPVEAPVVSKVESIVPPDAPKSAAPANADPVPGFEPPKKKGFTFVDGPPVAPKATAPSTTVVEDEEKTGEFELPADLGATVSRAVAAQASGSEPPVGAPPTPPDPPKRGRGRPKGSKNKLAGEAPAAPPVAVQNEKGEDVWPEVTEQPSASPKADSPDISITPGIHVETRQKPKVGEEDLVTIRSVTLSFGLTLNTGNFNSVRFDASVTADVQGSFDHAFKLLSQGAKEKVKQEMAIYENLINQK